MNKIILIRKKYTEEYEHLKKYGDDVFEYVWYEDINSAFDLDWIKNRVIWYRGLIYDKMWDKILLRLEQNNNIILNHPDKCKVVSNKYKYSLSAKDLSYSIKTWFKPEDAKFPCVEKPYVGHSGIGVKVVDSVKDCNIDERIWTEKIDFDSEWRVWCFMSTPIGYYRRNHIKGIEDKSTNDSVDFEYIEDDPENKELIKNIVQDVSKRYQLTFFAIDLFKVGNDWKVCEVNSQPGYKPKVWQTTIKMCKYTYM